MIELKLDDDTDSRPWTKLSNQTIVISVASSRDTAEACLAYVERWLVEAVKAQSSVDAACLAFVLHQNPFWARLPNFKCVHQEEVISRLKSSWSTARKFFVGWLTDGFIRSPCSLSQLVQVETCTGESESHESEIIDQCTSLIQAPPFAGILSTLFLFIKQEGKRLKTCIS